MSRRFLSDTRGVRVVFGAGVMAELPHELTRLGAKRALLLGTPGRSDLLDRAAKHLGPVAVDRFAGAAMHVPAATVTAALEQLRGCDPDCLVTAGGGSAVGLGKILARDTGLPLVAIPTTYAGSEMTSIWGLTDGARKTTGRDARVAPVTVLYDPELTVSLPPAVSAASGMNAAAHAVEALYAPDAAPFATMLALEALRLLAAALPRIVEAPDDLAARADALLGACCAGRALDQTTMGLHHVACHVLGGSFDLPHAETHAVLLAHVAAFNAAAAPEALAPVAAILDAGDAATGLHALRQRLGLPAGLERLGFAAGDVERAAALIVERRFPNPRPVTPEGIAGLLRRATEGSAPLAD